jgi:hypothetical protein
MVGQQKNDRLLVRHPPAARPPRALGTLGGDGN